jgi:hypothetical protein
LVAFSSRTNLSRNSCPGTPSPLHPTRSHHDSMCTLTSPTTTRRVMN